MHVHLGRAGGLAEELVGGAARFVGALRRQQLGVGVAHGAVAAQAVPHFRQGHDVGAVGLDGLADQAARLGDVLRLVGAGVHLDDADAHRGLRWLVIGDQKNRTEARTQLAGYRGQSTLGSDRPPDLPLIRFAPRAACRRLTRLLIVNLVRGRRDRRARSPPAVARRVCTVGSGA